MFAAGYDEIHFARDSNQRVAISFDDRIGFVARTTQYQQSPDGAWQVVSDTNAPPEMGPDGLEVKITQNLTDPPLLVAANKERSRVIWDPNPQLKNLQLGEARIYKWHDKERREWIGGLYLPVNYQPGKRYPLVIQTHGFSEKVFSPSGFFTTGSAARALASAGVMVLQTAAYGDRHAGQKECGILGTTEGPCEADVIESSAKQLVAEGLVDPDRIGVVGFSRTCYWVMVMLTTNSLRLKAASITDGIMADYFQYIFDGGSEEVDKMIGAKGFGEGLQEWLKRSPGFNLDKVNTPLLVNAEGRLDILPMWMPYAGLRYLHKPVDLIVLNSREHVITNPVERLASQGGSVDWFRFWLQDYEDPDPAKAEQYKRWQELSKMQEENEKKAVTADARAAQ